MDGTLELLNLDEAADRIIEAHAAVNRWSSRDFKRSAAPFGLTQTQFAILGLLPPNGRILGGEVALGDRHADGIAHALPERGARWLDGIDAERRVVVSGSTGEGLKWLAEEEEADIVVFGSDYRTPPGHVAPQRSAEKLLEGGVTAVAIAPADYRDVGAEDHRIRTIGVLASPGDDASIASARELAESFAATLTRDEPLVDLVLEPLVAVVQAELGQVLGHPAHGGGVGAAVVVEDDDQVRRLQVRDLVEGFVGHAAGQGAVAPPVPPCGADRARPPEDAPRLRADVRPAPLKGVPLGTCPTQALLVRRRQKH